MIAVFLLACMPTVTPDKVGSPGILDTAVLDSGEAPPTQTLAVIGTLADDYSVGAVATVQMDTLALSDTLSPTAGDAVVRAVEDQVAVLNRLNTDTVRLFDPADWSRPELELALPDLSNPQDAAMCGDKLWVSLHTADHVPAYDHMGRRVAKADLSDWTGTDGAAEALRMHVYEDTLILSVEQFAQDAGWVSEGGAVLQVDCQTAEVTELLQATPSPAIVAGPEAGTVLVRTGLYGELDGELMLLSLETLQTEVWLTESEVGGDITGVAAYGETLLYLSVDTDWTYRLHCRDIGTGDETVGMQTPSFLSDLQVDDRGRAWVTARAGWSSDADTTPGIHLFDAHACQALTPEGEAIRTTLNPFNVSFL